MEQDMQAKCNAQTAFKRPLMYQDMLSSKAACANANMQAGCEKHSTTCKLLSPSDNAKTTTVNYHNTPR
jgi:hypothetical protein